MTPSTTDLENAEQCNVGHSTLDADLAGDEAGEQASRVAWGNTRGGPLRKYCTWNIFLYGIHWNTSGYWECVPLDSQNPTQNGTIFAKKTIFSGILRNTEYIPWSFGSEEYSDSEWSTPRGNIIPSDSHFVVVVVVVVGMHGLRPGPRHRGPRAMAAMGALSAQVVATNCTMRCGLLGE